MKVILGTDTMHHCWVRGCFCQLKTAHWAWAPGSWAFHFEKAEVVQIFRLSSKSQFPVSMKRGSYLLRTEHPPHRRGTICEGLVSRVHQPFTKKKKKKTKKSWKNKVDKPHSETTKLPFIKQHPTGHAQEASRSLLAIMSHLFSLQNVAPPKKHPQLQVPGFYIFVIPENTR